MRRATLAAAALGLTIAAGAAAAADYQSSPPRKIVTDTRDWGRWLGPFRASLVPGLMEDFGEQYIYAAADRALGPPEPGERRVVFLGDSITDRWNLSASFPGKPYVNRGIGSQITPQMLLRFHADVVALHPAAVVILAGVNDVQGVLQVETAGQIEANDEAMADIADAHGIRVVFGSILPVNNYGPGAEGVLAERHPDELRAINDWLRSFSAARGYQYADYYSALVDAHGLLRRDLSTDGVHPLAAGYLLMAPIAEAAIDRALADVPRGGGDARTCAPGDLSLAFDGENGAFDGMSHGGALMVIRNVGPAACTLPGLPVLTFRNAAGQALPIVRQAPMGMHPGPVVLPVAVAPGAELTAPLRWVSGPVFDGSRCFDVGQARLAIGTGMVGARLAAHICGRSGASATVEQPVLRPDPTVGAPAR